MPSKDAPGDEAEEAKEAGERLAAEEAQEVANSEAAGAKHLDLKKLGSLREKVEATKATRHDKLQASEGARGRPQLPAIESAESVLFEHLPPLNPGLLERLPSAMDNRPMGKKRSIPAPAATQARGEPVSETVGVLSSEPSNALCEAFRVLRTYMRALSDKCGSYLTPEDLASLLDPGKTGFVTEVQGG